MESNKSNNTKSNNIYLATQKKNIKFLLFFGFFAFSCLFLYKWAYPFQFFHFPFFSSSSLLADFKNQTIIQGNKSVDLKRILGGASMENKTVILTTLNDAWAEPESIIDLFLESFKIGNNTNWLLNHLVIISLDDKAYNRCLKIHPYCYLLISQDFNFTREAFFMTPNYLEMMWRRIELLIEVLEMGYNFIFTDADVMWLQNPFPHFYPNVDFQIACDHYIGNSSNKENQPNGGFNYVKSNTRTIQFYKFWYSSRKKFPGKHDQDVLNKIKFDSFIKTIGVEMRFLDTNYFGGFCEPSKDFNLVCTLHANCCVGLENKINDLKIVLEDWKKFMLLPPSLKVPSPFTWRIPNKCRL